MQSASTLATLESVSPLIIIRIRTSSLWTGLRRSLYSICLSYSWIHNRNNYGCSDPSKNLMYSSKVAPPFWLSNLTFILLLSLSHSFLLKEKGCAQLYFGAFWVVLDMVESIVSVGVPTFRNVFAFSKVWLRVFSFHKLQKFRTMTKNWLHWGKGWSFTAFPRVFFILTLIVVMNF